MADSLGAALYARSQAVSALTALIGVRFYPGRLPQNPDYPAACWQLVTEERRPLASTTGHDGVPRARVQITAFARTRTAALQVVNAGLKPAFGGWLGSAGGVVVQGTSPENVTEVGYDARARVWQFACDFFVWYEAA